LFLLPLFLFAKNNLNLKIIYFQDYNQTYNITTVVSQAKQLFTKPLVNKHTKFPKNSVLWLKISLINHSDKSVEKVMQFLDIRLDRMDVYRQDGRLLNTVGDRVPFNNRVYKDGKISIDMSAEPGQTLIRYVRFTNEDKSDLIFEVYDKQVYIEKIIFEKILHAFFFGALLIMLVYNMILYLFIKEKTFLVYILYHIVLVVVMLYYNGVMSQYLYPDRYDVNGGNVPAFLSYIAIILAMQFLRYFLDAQKYTPRIDKWLKIFVYMNLILLILTSLINIPKIIPILNMMPLSLFLLYVAFYHAVVLKRKLALFYLFGWLVMLVAILLTGLLSMGAIERNDFTAYIFQIGIIIEITLLSMGLAYRYKINQEQLTEKTKVLHEQSKLASMGEMLRHIAHQWRQPLSEINSVAMKIENDHRHNRLDAITLDQNIEQIESITEHMSQTISDFNGYFKSDKEKAYVRLRKVVDKTLDLVEHSFSKNGITVEVLEKNDEHIEVVEGELVQVLLVLLNNARDALHDHDVKEKWIKITIDKVKGRSCIEVEDNGGGIAEENLSKVFEPYFTTKFESQGVGVGLYMSKMIVEESLGGILSVSNTVNGARFTIML